MVDHNDGNTETYCVWAKGVDSLLPVTHQVALMREEGVPAVHADWSRVMETCGNLMEPTDDYPRRYRVREFPDETVLDAIRSDDLTR